MKRFDIWLDFWKALEKYFPQCCLYFSLSTLLHCENRRQSWLIFEKLRLSFHFLSFITKYVYKELFLNDARRGPSDGRSPRRAGRSPTGDGLSTMIRIMSFGRASSLVYIINRITMSVRLCVPLRLLNGNRYVDEWYMAGRGIYLGRTLSNFRIIPTTISDGIVRKLILVRRS